MNYWLMKSEPDVYGIEDLKRDRTTIWDGVRNYQARNFLRSMTSGDLVFFYHSNTSPPLGIVGLDEGCRTQRLMTPRNLMPKANTTIQNPQRKLRAGKRSSLNLSKSSRN